MDQSVFEGGWIAAAIFLTCIALYTVWFFFKPSRAVAGGLKRYEDLPGPKEYPVIRNSLEFIHGPRPQIHFMWTRLARQHGSLFRVRVPGKNFVVVSDAKLLPAIIGRPGLPKTSLYQMTRPLFTPHGLDNLFTMLSINDPKWKAVRKGFAPHLSTESIRSIFPVSLSKTLEVCSKLTEIQAGKGTCRLDIQDAMQRLALDVILRVAFDIDGRNVEFGQCQLLENIHYCFDEIYRSMTNPFRPLAFRLCPWLPAAKPYHMRHRQLYQYWEDVVRVLRSRGAPEDTDTSCQACLRRLRNPETGELWSDKELMVQCSGIVVAGMDTTAHAVTWGLYCLAVFPGIEDAVAEELAAHGLLATPGNPEPRALEYNDLLRLSYLKKVVMESMRMFPVAGAGIGRYADRDIDLGGYHIPKGTEVAVCLHTLHNVPWNFPDPDTFSPERFSDAVPSGEASSSETPGHRDLRSNSYSQVKEGAAAEDTSSHRCFLPFSAGPRDCLGQRFAMMEVMSMLALLAGRFRYRLDDCMGGEEGVRALQISNFTLSVEGGLFMHVYSRAAGAIPPAVESSVPARTPVEATLPKPAVPGALNCTFTVSTEQKVKAV